jgi:RNA polymerase sigma-70 factor (ECF subfamily)
VPGAGSFPELIKRVRAGEEAAAAELVRLYEPAIRRAVRVRLVDARLERLFDSMDICQSVLASFFVRAAAGQYDLERPQQLVNLLVTMARNKVADQARKEAAQCRDSRRVAEGTLEEHQLVDTGSSPSERVGGQELYQEFRKRLSDQERQLADRRALGRDWADIAAEMHDSPEALRKRLTRAIDRVVRELGLEV